MAFRYLCRSCPGIYENGEWGGVLGTLDCQKTFESDVEGIDLQAGDAAVLARAVPGRGPCRTEAHDVSSSSPK